MVSGIVRISSAGALDRNTKQVYRHTRKHDDVPPVKKVDESEVHAVQDHEEREARDQKRKQKQKRWSLKNRKRIARALKAASSVKRQRHNQSRPHPALKRHRKLSGYVAEVTRDLLDGMKADPSHAGHVQAHLAPDHIFFLLSDEDRD